MAKNKGRPNKYESCVKPNLKKITEMCNTKTEKQIAEELGIGYSTWIKYKKDHPELELAIKKGRQDLVTDLRSTLIRKAKGYTYTETKTIIENIKWPELTYQMLLDAGLTPEQIGEAKIVRKEIAHKKMHPDVAAINLALKNYDKDNWANDPQMLEIRKQELELRRQQLENGEWS